MVTVEVALPLAVMFEVPVILEYVPDADPATKVTVPPAIAMGVNRERVFTSCWVEAKVQVDTPLELLEEHAP